MRLVSSAVHHLDRVLELVGDEAEALAGGLLGTGQVDDERAPAGGRCRAREHRATGDLERLGAHVLGDAGDGAIADSVRGLGRDVARAEARCRRT